MFRRLPNGLARVSNPFHSLWVAVGFLTRIPVGDVTRGGKTEVDMARAVPWFPVVGAGIGAISGGVYVLADEILNVRVAAAIAVGVALLVTGAFHHDGLADIADAFGGGWTIERRMEILKDSRLGTYGTAALCMALLSEVLAISELKGAEAFAAIVIAHSLGRAMALTAMLLAPAAGDGMGAEYMNRLSPVSVLSGLLFAVAITAFLSPVFPLAVIGVAAIPTIATVALAIRKIGGINGDVLGAVTVLGGLAVLVVSGAT